MLSDLRNYASSGTVIDMTTEPRPDDQTLATYRAHADLCKVLTDPKRLMVLDALRTGERSVGDLAASLGIALPNASQHLAVLRSAGLVDGRRTGTTVLYRLAEPGIVEACDIIHAIVERRLGARHLVAQSAPATALAIANATAPTPTTPAGTTRALEPALQR